MGLPFGKSFNKVIEKIPAEPLTIQTTPVKSFSMNPNDLALEAQSNLFQEIGDQPPVIPPRLA